MSEIKAEHFHCKHFVARKKRFCRMTVKTGREYCGEHEPSKSVLDCDEINENHNLRVTCPLDNKHTCYSHKLLKHLRVCNAKPKEHIPYIIKGINCGENNVIKDDIVTGRLLLNVPAVFVKDVIKKVNAIYDDVQINIQGNHNRHEEVEKELLKSEYGEKTRKHLIQTSSLLGLLKAYDLLQKDTCYIEFGAGKGQLSYWMSKATNTLENSSVLLIERAAHRHKLDNKLDKTADNVHRIRADIADLVLDKVDVVHKVQHIIGITKHLCGDATDLALRCLIKCEKAGNCIHGMVMAFCCHHRCLWSSYTGKDFFKSIGLGAKDFDVMCGMVSWATCGSGWSREKNAETDIQFLKQSDRDKEIGLTREAKAVVGKKCKYILNYGRLKFLENLGYKCNLHYYVNVDVSPENLCIVAVKSYK